MPIKLTKRKKSRANPHIKRGDKLKAPSWEGWEEWSGEQFHRHKDRSRDFYYTNYKKYSILLKSSFSSTISCIEQPSLNFIFTTSL